MHGSPSQGKYKNNPAAQIQNLPLPPQKNGDQGPQPGHQRVPRQTGQTFRIRVNRTMASQRPQNKRFTHISTALDQTLEPFRSRYGKGDFREIWRCWETTVGPEIAKNAKPVSFRNGCLTVSVTHSAWMQHLQYLKNDMMERINLTLGSPLIQDIRLRIGTP